MHRVDQLLVGCIVLASALYAFRSLAPRTYRRRLQEILEALRLRSLARRLAGAAAIAPGGACGGCDHCGSDGDAGPTAPERPGSRGSEVRVQLSDIGRRKPDPPRT